MGTITDAIGIHRMPVRSVPVVGARSGRADMVGRVG